METSDINKYNSPKSVCRTCLVESSQITNIQDLIEFEVNKIKLIDILVFLNCLENNDEENWPQGMCETCVATALVSYNFKTKCLKATSTLSELTSMHVTSSSLNRPNTEEIDINVVYQDHEYDVPLFHNYLSLECRDKHDENKELTPLPPVSEITSTEQPLRKEGEKKYSCNVCGKLFTRIYGLRYHMIKHMDVKKHLCPKCGKSFHTTGGLRQHIQSHREIGQFKCGFCNKNYKSKQSLKEHFRVAHSSNRHSFICTLCGKSFTAKSTLIMHTKTHDSVKQFACSDCPKTYTRASYLKIHRLEHFGIDRPKPFQCEHENCDRSFPSKHSLMVHVAHTHNLKRPHQCDVCNKCFATASGLKIHKESHLAKNITCNICGKKVGNKRMLQKHLKLHENVDADLEMENIVDYTFFDHIY